MELLSRSSTPKSRANIAKAKQEVARWRKKLKTAQENVRRLTQKDVSSDGKSSRAVRRERQRRLDLAKEKFVVAEKNLGHAQKKLAETKQANRDPLKTQAVAEQNHQAKKAGKQRKYRLAQIEKDLKKTKNQTKKLDRNIKRDPKNADSYKTKQQKLKDKQKRLAGAYEKQKNDKSRKKDIGEPRQSIQKTIKDATTVKFLEGEKGVFEGEKYLVPNQTLYDSDDGSGSITGKAIGAETTGKLKGTLSHTGFSGSAEISGQATLVEIRLKKEWVAPCDLKGERGQANMFVDVRGFVGAEGEAKPKANLGKLPTYKAEINQNAIMAEVDAFAGAKVEIGGGVGLSWFKQDLSVYRPRIESGATAIHGILIAIHPPLGAILSILNMGTGVTEKILEQLLDFSSKPGLVPLASVMGKGEASSGAGVSARAAIGLRNSQIVTQVKANATWGFGMGGELELMMDILEGPLFLPLHPATHEFVTMLKSYLRKKMERIGSLVLSLGSQLLKWLSSDDDARKLVAGQGHTALSLDDRVVLVENMLGGACLESDEQAILTILRDAKRRGDMSALVARVGKRTLSWKIDGENNDELHRIIDAG